LNREEIPHISAIAFLSIVSEEEALLVMGPTMQLERTKSGAASKWEYQTMEKEAPMQSFNKEMLLSRDQGSKIFAQSQCAGNLH
jgi:hypothetical protein